ncbi:hypothetical protein [Streptomyces sp. NPDC058955]|uniref:hypothetical protein n=1 Tax=unclassified Streptomyces TaxID=2593676 RepID=UPI0036617784
MEGVFDVAGRPPEGWMHAVFHGGPYGEDVGRCIPGPAPATMAVPVEGGGVYVYRLWAVGVWSGSGDPIAVYNPDGPPIPPPVLTAQEKRWIEEGRRRDGLAPVGLVAVPDDGRVVRDPDAPAVEGMLAALGERQYLLLQRLAECGEGDCHVLVLLAEDGTYEVERRSGAVGGGHRARMVRLAEVCGVVVGWAFGSCA